MKQSDEIEIKMTEILNIFYRKKSFFLSTLCIGSILSLLVVFIAIPTTSYLKLNYKINPMEEVDTNQLMNIAVNETRVNAFANLLNLKRHQLYTKNSEQSGQAFSIEKETFKNHNLLNTKLYDTLTFEFYVKSKDLSLTQFISEFENQVLTPSFSEFRQKQGLQNFLYQADKKKNYIRDAIKTLNSSIKFDRHLLDSIKNNSDFDQKNEKISINFNAPETKIDLRRNNNEEEKFEISSHSSFLARHFLSNKSQKTILTSIINEKNTQRNSFIQEHEQIIQTMGVVEKIIVDIPLDAATLKKYEPLLTNLDKENREELDLLFKDRVDVYRKNYYLISPNAQFKNNNESKIKVGLLIFFTTFIIATLLIFLSDYWDENKNDIIRRRN